MNNAKNIPISIFKYQSLNHNSLLNLQSSKLYFNFLENFNDPFDNALSFLQEEYSLDNLIDLYAANSDITNILYSLSNKTTEVKELIYFLSEQKKLDSSLYKELANEFGINESNNITKLYYADNLHERFHNTIINWSKNFLLSETYKIIESVKGKLSVSCFTSEVNSILMWSHYANSHKGFCLEFNTEFYPFSHIKQIEYTETFPSIPPNWHRSETDSDILINSLFFTKYKDWDYEKEFRILNNTNSNFIKYDPIALKAIYFGTRMDNNILADLKNIVRKLNPKIDCFKMEPDRTSFKLKASLLE